MIWIYAVLVIIVAFLSYLDNIITHLDIKKYGLKRESNSVIKELVKEGGEKATLVYKLVSLIAFAIIGYHIYLQDEFYFYILSGIVILCYMIVVIHNLKVFEKKIEYN